MSDVYHAGLGEDVAPSSVRRHTLAGVAVAETAATDHHVVESIVVLVLRVPALPQQCVAKREETGEVDPDIGHGDEL